MQSASYDTIAAIYDEDMGRNVGREDVDFYVESCTEQAGPVLELGCGTGRITLPVLGAGLDVVGLDISLPMLRVLMGKCASHPSRAELALICADMRAIPLAKTFATILCPYSAFVYLVTRSDQQAMLAACRALLAPGGQLLIDVFVPDPAIDELSDQDSLLDYRRTRSDGTFLERSRRVVRNVTPGVNVVTRTYRFLDAAGAEFSRITTQDVIHPWQPEALLGLLTVSGFDVDLFGDFRPTEQVGAHTRMAVFRCRCRGASARLTQNECRVR